MEYIEFANRIVQDLKREFNEVRLDEKKEYTLVASLLMLLCL